LAKLDIDLEKDNNKLIKKNIDFIEYMFSDKLFGNKLIKASEFKISIILAICFSVNYKYENNISGSTEHILNCMLKLNSNKNKFSDNKCKPNLVKISNDFCKLLDNKNLESNNDNDN
jgi:hypothetical protein